MTGREAAQRDRLRAVLDARWPAWGVGELELVGAGLDAAVFRAASAAFGSVAIRAPWTRWISNDNDPSLDARALLAQEQLLANHMRAHGVPAPRGFALHTGDDDFDFLVSAYVPDDGSDESPGELGAVMRRIHDAPVGPAIEAALATGELAAILAIRLTGRLRAVERLSGAVMPRVAASALRERFAAARYRPSVLHMDVRRANIRVAGGEIRAILDWSNALLGDPALELARAAEFGVRSAAFDAGYGALPDVPAELELLYRLDTAVMLAVVFLSEAPDPAPARRQLARVDELVARLGLS